MQAKLTSRQKAILDFIKSFAVEKGYPPTIPEIQHEFGIKSPNGVNNHLKALMRKGYLRRDSSRARALDIVGFRSRAFEGAHVRDERFPILGSVAAGLPILAEENLEGYFKLEDIYPERGNMFVLHVEGESMINAGIHDGDYVMVRVQPTVEQGEIGVAVIGNEATVKRIYSDGNIVELVPENDSMKPFTCTRTDPDFSIAGKVIGVIRKM